MNASPHEELERLSGDQRDRTWRALFAFTADPDVASDAVAEAFTAGASDFAHGDLNISNVLVERSTITGVVDWDEFGLNSRAADLASIMFDWKRLHPPEAVGAGYGGRTSFSGASSRSRASRACVARCPTPR